MAARFVWGFDLILITMPDQNIRWVDIDVCITKDSKLLIKNNTLVIYDCDNTVVFEENLENLEYIDNIAEYLGAEVVLDMGRKYTHYDEYRGDPYMFDYWYTVVLNSLGEYMVVHLGDVFKRLYHHNGVYFTMSPNIKMCISYKIPEQYVCTYFNVPKLFMETYIDNIAKVSFDDWPGPTPFIKLTNAKETLLCAIHVTEGPMDSAGNPVEL